MNLVFHISEDGSEIELKYCVCSKTTVKSSRKHFVHLNWIRLATDPNWFDKLKTWIWRENQRGALIGFSVQ